MIQLSKFSMAKMLLNVSIEIYEGMFKIELKEKYHTPCFPQIWAEE